LLSDEEIQALLSGYRDLLEERVSAATATKLITAQMPQINLIIGKRNEEYQLKLTSHGSEFIENYLSTNPTAIKTSSGLVYHEVVQGTGNSPSLTSTVRVHYTGKLSTGIVFDSSHNHGKPIQFGLGQVIPGWQEGLQLMKAGGKAVIVIPSELAYGKDGSPPNIPPLATIYFDVELIDVE
jgi:FKBP-type peptidyl-prolyl cis-trans isomerase FkpA